MSLTTPPDVYVGNKKLSKDDLTILKDALDIYTRLLMGQFTEVAEHLKIVMKNKVDKLTLDILEDKLISMQKLLHGEAKRSWGLYDPQVPLTASKANKVEHLLLGHTHIVKELQQHIEEQVTAIIEKESNESR